VQNLKNPKFTTRTRKMQNWVPEPEELKIRYPNPNPKNQKLFTRTRKIQNWVPEPEELKIRYPNPNPKNQKLSTRTRTRKNSKSEPVPSLVHVNKKLIGTSKAFADIFKHILATYYEPGQPFLPAPGAGLGQEINTNNRNITHI